MDVTSAVCGSRILTFGAGLRMDDWRNVIKLVRQQPGAPYPPP